MNWIDIASIVFVCVTMNHLGLIKAIEEGDSKTAGDVLREHMMESVKMMSEKQTIIRVGEGLFFIL